MLLETRMDIPETPEPPAPEAPATEAEARAVEAAAVRRRWITIGEVLTVAAVLISAMTLWLNWTERSGGEAEKVAERTRSAVRAATLTLTAQPSDKGARIDIRPVATEQSVQAQTIRFPAALGIAPVETTGDSRIEAEWFADALARAREKAGLPDASRGDERLPVAIETRFLVDGDAHTDIALYDVGYTIAGRILSGHVVTLRGLSLIQRTRGDAAAALDARWTRLVPPKRD
jgi:hypothetical protein